MIYKIKKQLCIIAIFSILFLAFAPTFIVDAAGNTLLQITNRSPKVGDTFTVNVSGTESATIKLTFNSSVLSLTGASVDGTTNSNSFTFSGKSADLSFKAIAEGTSGLLVESETLNNCSININVEKGEQSAQTATTESEVTDQETPDEATDTNEIPGNIQVTEIGNTTPFPSVIIMVPESLPDDCFVETVCDTESGSFDAYKIESSDNGLYYIYGVIGDGVPGWYVYDSIYQTVSRADLSLLDAARQKVPEPTEETAEETVSDGKLGFLKNILDSVDIRLVIAIGVFVLALIIVVIINAVLKKKIEELEDEDDYEYEDEDDEKEYAQEKHNEKKEIPNEVSNETISDGRLVTPVNEEIIRSEVEELDVLDLDDL